MLHRHNCGIAIAAAAVLLAGALFGQAPEGQIIWRPGVRVERQLPAPGTDTFEIPLVAGQFVRLEILQNGSDLAVSLLDPQGRSLIDADSANARFGPETLVAIAPSSGTYRVQVKNGAAQSPSGTYEAQLLELRESRPADADIIAAHRRYAEGEQLRLRRTEEARRQSVEQLDRAREFFRGSDEPYMYGLALYSLGAVLGDSGEFTRALALYQEAIDLFRRIGDVRMEARALNNAAGALDVLGDPWKALQAFRQALPAIAADGDRRGQANLLNNIAMSEQKIADWQAALGDFQQALSLARQAGDRRLEGLVLNNLGVAYRRIGETEQALTMFEQALPHRRASNDRRGEITTLENLADMFRSLQQPAKALQYIEESLKLIGALADRRLQAWALRFQGATYTDLQQYEKAQASLVQALGLARAVQDRRTTGEVLASLAQSSLLTGRAAEAADWSAQAIAEFRAVGDRSYEAVALEIAARAADAAGNPREARRTIEEALRVTEETRKAADSQQLRASFFATRQDAYEFYVDLLMRTGDAAAALEVHERSRARSLLEMLGDTAMDIREGVDPKLLAREREISALLNGKGTRLLNAPQSAELSREIRELESEYQDVQAAIRKSSPRYAALTQPEPLRLAQIQQDLLDDDTVLLEYALGAERSYLWAVDKHDLHWWKLPAREAIEQQVERVSELLTARSIAPRLETSAERQKRIGGADAALATASRELSDMILAPAAAMLNDQKLVVVPDGALQRLPFAMLPASLGRASEPLIVSHEVVMLPSASALAALRAQISGRKPATKMVAVFADPVFDSTDPRAGRNITGAPPPAEASRILEHLADPGSGTAARLKIPRLPYTAQEAEEILKVARGGVNLKAVGLDANRATATSAQLNDYRYIHFATHGYLDTERPSLSALVLSQIDGDRQAEDGFLRVNDIYNARLSADLVVLSACQTGLGKEVRGEGLMGLTRAFLYANAPRVIVSLWNVNDRATADLMASLYRKMLRDGKRPSAALREAQLEMRKQKPWESPYYWAAFVQHGEWR
jgi:CHAT domain-containing protein/uncharacterized protein HemY